MNAHSQDPGEKIVEAVFGQAMGKSEVARAFGVSLSLVKRYVEIASEGRSPAPKKRPGSKPKLGERARWLLSADLEERPFATLSARGNIEGGGRDLGERLDGMPRTEAHGPHPRKGA
jgi:transposase